MGASVRDFLRRVVPWPNGGPGFINAHYRGPRFSGMGGRPFDDLDQFMAYAIAWGNQNPSWVTDMYYCLSLQKDTGGAGQNGRIKAARSRQAALKLNAAWIDVDGYKEYPTKEAASKAIGAFIKAAGLPPPTAIVDSGGGWHVYWISDRELTYEEWLPFAYGLWEKVQQHGLKADNVTTDAARILRVPGTFNHKQLPPRPVVLKYLAPDSINFDAAMPKSAMAQNTAKPGTALLYDPAEFPQKAAVKDDLAPECKVDLTLDPRQIIKECPHFLDAWKTGGFDHDQGLWMQTVLATTWWPNGRDFAHKFSDKYPTYAPDETDAMYDRKVADRSEKALGWPLCSTFEREGCKLCAQCVHKGKIKSPLNLGQVAQVTQQAAPTASFTATVTGGVVTPLGMHIPAPYMIHPVSGKIGYMKSTGKTVGGTPTQTNFVELFDCVLANPFLEKHPPSIRFTSTADLGKTVEVTVKYEEAATSNALKAALMRQQCVPNLGESEQLSKFMGYWIAELQRAKEAEMSVPYGWWEHGDDIAGFAFGGKTIKMDKTISKAGYGDPHWQKWYTPKGQLKPWLDALKLVTDQHRPALEVIVASSFASPLLTFTQQHSAAINGWGDTAANKSTAIDLALSVWGHPLETKESRDSSKLGILKKMAEVRNLPLYWDDVSTPEELDRAATVLSSATEGKGGNKLKSNRETQDTGSWCTMLTVCSNRNLWDRIAKKAKSDTSQVHRLFAYRILAQDANTPGRLAKTDAITLRAGLTHNYGKMGEIYSAFLGVNVPLCRQLVHDAMNTFGKKVNEQDAERFWVAVCATIIVGARIANEFGASFHLDAIEAFLVQEFLNLRSQVKEEHVDPNSYQNITNVLSGFINTRQTQLIRCHDLPSAKPGRPQRVQAQGPNADSVRDTISMCLDMTRSVLKISKREFLQYLDDVEENRSAVFDGLVNHYGMKKKFPQQSIAYGTHYNSAPESLMYIPVVNDPTQEQHWLWDLMYNRTPEDQQPPAPATHSGQSAAAPAPSGTAPTP